MYRKLSRQTRAYAIGLLASVVFLGVLLLPGNEALYAHGPMNVGHEDFACEQCHKKATGTVRQQIQANLRYFLGFRERPTEFVFKRVSNQQCLDCHNRPKDNHPVFRFFEPKYSKIRTTLKPHSCVSCHLEHTGKRTTVALGFCRNCHDKLALKKDPVQPSHKKLVKNNNWESCLGCHDYHGNHRMKVKSGFDQRISAQSLQDYFSGAASPYSEQKKYKAKKPI